MGSEGWRRESSGVESASVLTGVQFDVRVGNVVFFHGGTELRSARVAPRRLMCARSVRYHRVVSVSGSDASMSSDHVAPRRGAMARKRDVVARSLPIIVALAFAIATLNTSNRLSALRGEHGRLEQLHRIATSDLKKLMAQRDCKEKLDALEVTHAEDLATHVSETQMKIEEYEGANKDLRDELKACELAKSEARANEGEAMAKLESSRNEVKQFEQEISQMRAQGCREDPPAPDAPSSS